MEGLRKKIRPPYQAPLGEDTKRICRKFVENNHDINKTALDTCMSSKAVKQILQQKRCQPYILWQQNEYDRKVKLDVNFKLYKLKRVVDEFIPDQDTLDPKKVTVGISAIAESNKMQGHYSAEKNVNLNINADADLKKIEETVKALDAEYKREY